MLTASENVLYVSTQNRIRTFITRLVGLLGGLQIESGYGIPPPSYRLRRLERFNRIGRLVVATVLKMEMYRELLK